ncbi:hypothetical protein ACHAQA_003617 [Verticillium albo-atrum]
MTTDAPRSSGGSRFLAFLDLIVKLAATGALIGILVLLLKINENLTKVIVGDNTINVGVAQRGGSSAFSIDAILRTSVAPISVNIDNPGGQTSGSPVWIRNAEL